MMMMMTMMMTTAKMMMMMTMMMTTSNDDDNGKDDDDENVAKTSLDEGNVPVTNIATSQDESLLSFSSSVGNTTTPALLQPDNQLVENTLPPTPLTTR